MILKRWRFWVSFLAAALPFLSLVLGGILGLGAVSDRLGLASGVLAVIYLAWRSLARRASLPPSGLEGVLLAGLLAVILSLVFSPDPRMGLEQALGSLGYVLMFYVLVDAFAAGASRTGAVYGLLFASGIVVAFAVLETYAWYSAWWQQSGSILAMPPYPYRMISLLGHSNAYMAFANLAAPLALVIFLTSPRRVVRFAAGLWMAFYAISVPFSSSRGGWLGAAAWIGLLVLFWLAQGARWRRWLAWLGRFKVWGYAGVALLALLGLAAALQAFLTFAAHPSHGSDPFGGRSELWGSALRVWQSSPWVGAGVGRYPYEYLRVTPDFPPRFWSPHAHNMYLTVLAEQGLVGFAAFMALVVVGLIFVFRWQHNSPAQLRPWGAALVAGMVGWLVHSTFDDFTNTLPVMVMVVLLAALLRSMACPHPGRLSRIPLVVLLAFVVGAVGLGGWLTWSGAPFEAALKAAPGPGEIGWRQAAQLAEESARRDPFFVYYQVEAGLAWAQAWGESGDPTDLARARDDLARGLEMEPHFSMAWANAAVLDWFAGEQNLAVDRMQRAVAMAPHEPSYPLNLGLFLETLGRSDEAAEAYRKALDLEASWSTHPFWEASALRQQVAGAVKQAYLRSLEETPPYWKQAQEALDAGQIEESRAALALARAVGEDSIAVLIVQARIDQASGNEAGAQAGYLQLVSKLNASTIQDGPYLASIYASTHRRKGFDLETAPGYFKVRPDVGQQAVLRAWYLEQVSAGDCDAARKTWLAVRRDEALEARAHDRYPDCGAPLP